MSALPPDVAAAINLAEVLDALALLAVDRRTDPREPEDPLRTVCRWLFNELTERALTPEMPPRLDFTWIPDDALGRRSA